MRQHRTLVVRDAVECADHAAGFAADQALRNIARDLEVSPPEFVIGTFQDRVEPEFFCFSHFSSFVRRTLSHPEPCEGFQTFARLRIFARSQSPPENECVVLIRLPAIYSGSSGKGLWDRTSSSVRPAACNVCRRPPERGSAHPESEN